MFDVQFALSVDGFDLLPLIQASKAKFRVELQNQPALSRYWVKTLVATQRQQHRRPDLVLYRRIEYHFPCCAHDPHLLYRTLSGREIGLQIFE
jgi:hypothetical protein